MYFQYFLHVFFNKFEKNSRVHAGRISIGAEHVRTERNTTNRFRRRVRAEKKEQKQRLFLLVVGERWEEFRRRSKQAARIKIVEANR